MKETSEQDEEQTQGQGWWRLAGLQR